MWAFHIGTNWYVFVFSNHRKWRLVQIPEPKHVIILVVTVTGRGSKARYKYEPYYWEAFVELPDCIHHIWGIIINGILWIILIREIRSLLTITIAAYKIIRIPLVVLDLWVRRSLIPTIKLAPDTRGELTKSPWRCHSSTGISSLLGFQKGDWKIYNIYLRFCTNHQLLVGAHTTEACEEAHSYQLGMMPQGLEDDSSLPGWRLVVASTAF